jgi:hypothetical protein
MEKNEMVSLARSSFRILAFIVGAMASAAAVAAPVEGATSQDCFSRALIQHTLDYAHCSALPIQIRNPCILQAEMTYAAATGACATKSTSQQVTPPMLKQNLDAAFTRRLR